VLYFNVFAPATFQGYYTSNPIPAFLPESFFIGILGLQVILVWGTIGWWIIRLFQRRQRPPFALLTLAILLWLVPIIFAATTHINEFAMYWIDYAIWRWFGASYVGFSLLVALSWADVRPIMKHSLANASKSLLGTVEQP
jgi:hypothetical protein